jgi:peptidoglycan-N-acetylglucosamine deacetylase
MHWIWTAASLATAGLMFTRARVRRQVCLTFDDGPSPEHTPALLDLLAEHQVPATFFLIGSKISEHPAIVQRIVAEGHSLGNHSFNHPRFDRSSMRKQWEEIERTEQALTSCDGLKRHLVRPPYGRLGLGTLAVCLARRQRIALWNRDSLDYRLEREQIISRFESQPIRRGDVLLFHDDGSPGIDALRVLLPRWRKAGLEFGTL